MKHITSIACLLAVSIASAQTQPKAIVLHKRLFGWADLHAHPASHLAFGADTNGENGIFWGKPGGKWVPNYSGVTQDMKACSYKHGGFDGDVVRHETHKGLMEGLDSVTEYPHQTADFGENNHGAPSYEHWPHARSITHEQMHITEMRRAYEGGQRLLIASVTDNEFLSDMWTQIGHKAGANPVPAINPYFGFNSAVRQINFIKDLATQNSEWMKIAYSPAEARTIIDQDKMAIILSLEIDSLTEQQVLVLVQMGVRHVIPVHLIDNDFGGTAVYSDAFNAVNNFVHSDRDGGNLLNNGFLKVNYDSKLKFRLGWPKYPRPEGFNLISGGAINLDPVPLFIWAALGYNLDDSKGHRNKRGLSNTGADLLLKLAKQGVIIDVAHMGYQTTADTLSHMKQWGYPVMDSHTNLRNADGTAHSERDLDRTHAKTIADLGGVIGLGTEWDEGFVTLVDLDKLQYTLGYNPQIPGNSNDPSWYQETFNLTVGDDPELSQLRFRIVTGGDDLATDLNAVFTIDGVEYKYLLNKWHENWRPGLVTTPTVQLPKPVKVSKLKKITLRINHGDNWSLKELRIEGVPYGADPVSTWLARFKEGLDIMGGKGMAIGTDFNGFAPQLYLPADDVKYPIDIAHKISSAAYTPLLGKAQLGSRTFDFKADGIAHYGMLPDFMQALHQQPDSFDAVDALFHSANDVVVMWEKCAKVAPTL